MLQRFRMRMYGDYTCSCGCGKVLGTNSVFSRSHDEVVAVCVGDEADDEGRDLRCFRPSCFKGIEMLGDEAIYASYPAAPMVKEA